MQTKAYVVAVLLLTVGCGSKDVPAPGADSSPATVNATPAGGPDAGIPATEGAWRTDFAAATQEATRLNRPIFVDFSGSDWCVWCEKFDKEVLSQDVFKAFAADNLVLFLADFPRTKPQPEAVRKQNEELARKYGVNGSPTVLLLDPAGGVIAQTGYKPGGAAAYVEHVKSLLKRE